MFIHSYFALIDKSNPIEFYDSNIDFINFLNDNLMDDDCNNISSDMIDRLFIKVNEEPDFESTLVINNRNDRINILSENNQTSSVFVRQLNTGNTIIYRHRKYKIISINEE